MVVLFLMLLVGLLVSFNNKILQFSVGQNFIFKTYILCSTIFVFKFIATIVYRKIKILL